MTTLLLIGVTAGVICVVVLLMFAALLRVLRLIRGAQKPLRIYVSGPFTHGNREDNIARAVEAGTHLLDARYCPYVPHLSVHLDDAKTRHYEEWMRMDFAYLAVCDAVIRLPGYSPGADREVAMAKERGIPVYYSVEDFLKERGQCSA